MHDNQRVLVTKEGLKTLHEEYDELAEKKRPAAVERLSRAKAEGDLKENSEYSAAIEELSFIDGRISELEEVIRYAKAVPSAKGHKTVQVGSTVKVKVNGTHHVFAIVGEWEADPKEKKISHSSPIGKALLGKKKGEEVEVQAPIGKVKYSIVDVH